MPFPLAHPAAVLPLRRFCPRRLSFLALVLGSLSPDLGYVFRKPDLADLSHQPLLGTLLFCLPVGLVLVLGVYLVRLPLTRLLPARARRALLPLCLQPTAPPFRIAVSILLGALTHQWLDAATHPQFWLVRLWPMLIRPVPIPGRHPLPLCELLYAACTFFGVAWLAWSYLRWWGRSAGAGLPSGLQWVSVAVLAGGILWLAVDARSPRHHLGLVRTAMGCLVLTGGFLLAASWPFGPPGGPRGETEISLRQTPPDGPSWPG
jgi:hypothetical protein